MNQDLRICFIGDSFVNGTGDETKLGWTGRVCAELERKDPLLEITFYNLGIRRDTTEDIRRRVGQEMTARLQGDFDTLVVLSFGVNDTTVEDGQLRVAPEQSLENARAIITHVQQKHMVVMVGPPPIADDDQNTRITELDKAFGVLCDELAVPYLSVAEWLIDDLLWRAEVASNDGAHPRSGGYSLLAEYVLNWDAWTAHT